MPLIEHIKNITQRNGQFSLSNVLILKQTTTCFNPHVREERDLLSLNVFNFKIKQTILEEKYLYCYTCCMMVHFFNFLHSIAYGPALSWGFWVIWISVCAVAFYAIKKLAQAISSMRFFFHIKK